MKIEYVVQDEGKYPEGAIGISEREWLNCSNIGKTYITQMAVVAAENYHYHQDGWECSWPLTFEIYIDGEKRGVFEVERVPVPEFTAKEIKGKGL